MKYVVVGKTLADSKKGIYCQFLDLPNWQKGFGGQCIWGKLRSATIFDTPEEANKAINSYPYWVESCGVVVATVHPLNLVNR